MHKPQKGVVPRANVILTASKGIIGNYSAVSRYSRAKLRAFPPLASLRGAIQLELQKSGKRDFTCPSRAPDHMTSLRGKHLTVCFSANKPLPVTV